MEAGSAARRSGGIEVGRKALVVGVDRRRLAGDAGRRPGGEELALVDAGGRRGRNVERQAEVPEDLACGRPLLDGGDDAPGATAGTGEDLEKEDASEQVPPGHPLDARSPSLAPVDAAQAGVAVRAVSPTYAGSVKPAGPILGFGGFEDRQIEEAARRLGDVIGGVGASR